MTPEDKWREEKSINDEIIDSTKENSVAQSTIVINQYERPNNLNFQQEYERRFLAEGATPLIDMEDENSVLILWLCLIIGGFLGAHRFILGHWALGFLYLFTLGLFFIGVIADVFALPQLILEAKENQRMNKNKN
jgi:TM2 domain-containing membrane protein YozV